jgi:hypothetical protein
LNPHHSTNSRISNLCIFLGHQEKVDCKVFSFWFTVAFFHETNSGSNSTMSLYLYRQGFLLTFNFNLAGLGICFNQRFLIIMCCMGICF